MSRNTLRGVLFVLFGLLLTTAHSWAQPVSDIWKIADIPQPGNNLRKICLGNQRGKWVELDADVPSNCTEMMVAERDSRWIWPDKDFYAKRRRSQLFRMTFTYSIGTIFEVTPMVQKALTESGTFARLDQEVASGEKNPQQVTCEKAFDSVTTLDELSALERKCPGYPASRVAYKRIIEADDLAKEKQRESKATPFQPDCTKIEFSGIAVGDAIDLAPLTAAPNKDDIIARHPLSCGPSGITQLYGCQGAAWFSEHTGYIIAWTQTAYQIATPVDLTRGRKDTMLYINRKDAICRDRSKPSTNFTENWRNFLIKYNKNR